ncbi:MAG: hypothetical protein F4Z60_11060 [Chloroflexi bacterium]|nr:hypothetical protein [Chloroflexota bacterium]
MMFSLNPLLVMPGLVPGISLGIGAARDVDGRNKSGHDGGVVEPKTSHTPAGFMRTSETGH